MACSCAGGSLAEYSDIYELAFTGRQIDREVRDGRDEHGVRLVFEVERVYLGEGITSPVEIFTEADGAGCGASFPANEVVTVLGAEWNGKMSTNLCDQVFDAGPVKLAAIYGEGYVPDEVPLAERATLPLPVISAAGAVLVYLLLWLAFRWRREQRFGG